MNDHTRTSSLLKRSVLIHCVLWVLSPAGGQTWKGDRECKRPTGNKTFGGIGPLSDFEWALSSVTQLGNGTEDVKDRPGTGHSDSRDPF